VKAGMRRNLHGQFSGQ